MDKEIGEALSETRGNVSENGRKHMGHLSLRGFLRHLVTSSQEDMYRFIKTGEPTNVRESPLFLLYIHTFFCL